MPKKSKVVGVRLEPETFDRLKRKADECGHSPSSMLRQLAKGLTAQKGDYMTGAPRTATIIQTEFTVDVLQNTDLSGDEANKAAREMMEKI